MLHGKVPYRDLADQKGPIIFFIYALSLMFNEKTFFGVFFVELISATLFLYYSIKTLKLFCDVEKIESGIAFALATVTFSSRLFAGGGGPEELSLCIFSFLVYLGIRYWETGIFPNRVELLFLGIGAGLLFWTKFNLCIMYIIIFVFVLIHAIKRREVTRVGEAVLFIVIGTIIVTIPVLIYFAANDSLDILFRLYFYENVFMYGTGLGFLGNLRFALYMQIAKRNFPALAFLFVGFVWMLYSKKVRLFIFSIVTFVLTFILLNCGHPHAYTSMPVMVFAIFGFGPIVDVLARKHIVVKKRQVACIAVLFTLGAYVLCQNTNEMLVAKEDTVQYSFVREMDEGDIKDYSLLYFGPLDTGFYFAADYLPEWRAYVATNQGGTELTDLQYSYVNNKETDYIVTRMTLCDTEQYDQIIQGMTKNQIANVVSFDDFSYEVIKEGSIYDNGKKVAIRLYKIKS